MSLSPSIQQRLDTARVLQLQYRPNDEITAAMRTKTLAMVVAPSACGKSYLTEQIAAKDPECARVIDFTTRPRRTDDPAGEFEYFAHDDTSVSAILDAIHRRDLVQYMVHPTTGYLYWTEIRNYPGRYNVLETISSVVTVLRTLPFERTLVIGVVVEHEQWQQWFDARFPATDPERLKRLQEAVTSLEWLTDITHADLIHWVINDPSRDGTSVMIDIVKHGARGDDGRTQALAMLDWARAQLAKTI